MPTEKDEAQDRVIRINAQAARQGIEGHEARIVELETEVATLRNLIQTQINQVASLQRTMALALQGVRGTGSTS